MFTKPIFDELFCFPLAIATNRFSAQQIRYCCGFANSTASKAENRNSAVLSCDVCDKPIAVAQVGRWLQLQHTHQVKHSLVTFNAAVWSLAVAPTTCRQRVFEMTQQTLFWLVFAYFTFDWKRCVTAKIAHIKLGQ